MSSLQDPRVKKIVRDALDEGSASLTRIEAERDLVKEIAKRLQDEHEIPKNVFKKMLRVYHKQNFSKVTEENEEFVTAYESVLGSRED